MVTKKSKSMKESKQKTKSISKGTREKQVTLLENYSCERKRVKISEIIVDYVEPDEGLRKSRKTLGETNDITLNELPNLEPGKKYHVIDGRKRINDSIKKGREEIDAKVFKNLPVDVCRYITLVQNLTRSSSPVVEANAIRAELNKGKTIAEISAITGISITVLNQRLRLLELPKAIIDKLNRNEITYSVAKRMTSLPKDVQNKLAKEENITGDIVEEAHRKHMNSQLDFRDIDLPEKPNEEASIRTYHVTCAGEEKNMTRKELVSGIDEMLAGLSKGDSLVIVRNSK